MTIAPIGPAMPAAGVMATRPEIMPEAAPSIEALPRVKVSTRHQETTAAAVAMKVLTVASMAPGGWSEVRRRNHKLAVAARRLLAGRLGLTPPCPETMLGSMATLPLPERFQNRPVTTRLAAEQTELFQRFGIEVPLVKVGGLRCFRVSAHLHNDLSEYEYLAAAWERIS